MRPAASCRRRRDERALPARGRRAADRRGRTAPRPSASPAPPARGDDRDAARPGRRARDAGARAARVAAADLELPPSSATSSCSASRCASSCAALLVVAGDDARPAPTARALRGLATQVSLALESAALTEEVHRRAARRASARWCSTQRPHHRARRRRHDRLPEPVDRARARLHARRGHRHPLRRAARARRAARRLRTCSPTASARRPAQTEVLECALRHRDGTSLQFEILHTNLLDDEHVRGIVLNARDVSERKAFEEQLAHQAFHDPVTGLANRALFGERVRHAVARALPRGRAASAVIFLDLDDFKTINDSLGHAAGDQVLMRGRPAPRAQHPRQRHRRALRRRRVRDPARGRRERRRRRPTTAERILEALAAPLRVDAEGALAARQPRHLASAERRRVADAEELIRNADAAMYIAKRDGKGGYRLFEPRDARGRARAPRAARRPAARAGHRPVRAALPAGRAPRRRRGLRRRGAACAGATPSAASSRPTSSSRSPRRPA